MLRMTFLGSAALIAASALLSTAEGCGGHTTTGDRGERSDSGPEAGVSVADSGGVSARPDSSTPDAEDAATAPPPTPPTDVQKVDILFDIDNSASMGDKQAYLAQAIPDLLTRLVTPELRRRGAATPRASRPTSTATARSVDRRVPARAQHAHRDRQLVARAAPRRRVPDHGARQSRRRSPAARPSTATTTTRRTCSIAPPIRRNLTELHRDARSAAAGPGELPRLVPASVDRERGEAPSPGPTPITDPAVLESDFQQLVMGVHQFGCGIESQLESWYRFLVQPDPYASLTTATVNGSKVAQWAGGRHDHPRAARRLLAPRLARGHHRPDRRERLRGRRALVRRHGLQLHGARRSIRRAAPRSARPTRATRTARRARSRATRATRACAHGGRTPAPTRLGLRPQPAARAREAEVRRLGAVPDSALRARAHVAEGARTATDEYPPTSAGDYRRATRVSVAANLNCTNPLFAAQAARTARRRRPRSWHRPADELCNLPAGTRNAGLVYYAHIGGVPHQLLQANPGNPDSPQKDDPHGGRLEADPRQGSARTTTTAGIDPHMIESYQSRMGAGAAGGRLPRSADLEQPKAADPISGRECVTDSTSAEHQGLRVDREYACTFKLAAPRDCSDRRPRPIRRCSTRAIASLPRREPARSRTTRCRPCATTRRRPGRTSRRRTRRSESSSSRSFSARCPEPTRGSSRPYAPSTPWRAKRAIRSTAIDPQ